MGRRNKTKKCKTTGCNNDAPKGKKHCNKHRGTKTLGGGLPSKVDCHTGQKSIFAVGDIEVFGGGRNRAGGWQKMSPPPDLAMGPSETLGSWGKSKTEVPEGWSCGDTLTEVEPLMISFDWPDYSIPKVGREFWYALINDIHEHGIKRISCQCAGGHGRTGVQLAILAYLLSGDQQRAEQWPDAATLIKWVRKAHCVHAVEAKSQQEYIAMVCQIPVGEMLIVERSFGYYGDYAWSGSVSSQWKDIDDVDDDKIMSLADAAEEQAVAMQDELTGEAIDIPVEVECPICTSTDIEDSYCRTCDTDLITWEDDVQLHVEYCPLCDGDVTVAQMVEHAEVCSLCHAKSLDMDVRLSSETIQCTDCGKFKPDYQFFRVGLDDTTCAACYYGLTKKPKSKKMKKPKSDPSKSKDGRYFV